MANGSKELQLNEPLDSVSGVELSSSASAAAAVKEIEVMAIIARRFPRNELQIWQSLQASMKRFTMADAAEYSYPRGGGVVHGPSIYLMREMARLWGNMLHGWTVVYEDSEGIVLRAFAWDLQTNHRQTQEAVVKRLIQKKNKSGGTDWVEPDERDWRERMNNIGARTERNCIRAILPPDYIEDAVTEATKTIEANVKADPKSAVKAILKGFNDINVSVDMLEIFLKCPLGQASPAQLTQLRSMWKTIKDGEKTFKDFLPEEVVEPGTVEAQQAVRDKKIADLKKKADEAAKATPAPTAPPAAMPSVPPTAPDAQADVPKPVAATAAAATAYPWEPGDEVKREYELKRLRAQMVTAAPDTGAAEYAKAVNVCGGTDGEAFSLTEEQARTVFDMLTALLTGSKPEPTKTTETAPAPAAAEPKPVMPPRPVFGGLGRKK